MAFQGDSIFWVEVEKITPNPFQPRREFDQDRLGELSESIRMYGVLQPLTVTRKEIRQDNGAFYTQYELIAGERRLRAAKLADISLVPVIIREGEQNEQEKLELAIIENLQREDLNAVDRALAFRQLADTFNLTHTQVAKKVGRSREYVSNSVRLLALPEYMLQSLRNGEISEGHARTLLMMSEQPEEQDTVFREIILKKLSVREVERIARSVATDKVRRKDKYYDPEIIALEKQFTETLGTRVQIQKTDFGGKLTIDYFSPEDLSYMLERMRDEAMQQSGRRPFSPPQNPAVAAAPDTAAEQVAQLSDSTPLSALIAQLQQAEGLDPDEVEQLNRVSGPVHTPPVQPEVPQEELPSEEVTLPEVSQAYAEPATSYVPPVSHASPTSSQPVPAAPEEVDGPRVTLTDAPVSPIPQQAPAQSAPFPTPRAVSDANALRTVARGPRIVCVNRDCTTAVYVAAVPTTASEIPASLAETSAAPSELSDDTGDLYSIRNFNI